MAKNYEVLVDELTILKKTGDLTDPITGRVLGIQQGQGRIVFKGEVISGNDVSPLLIEALEDDDHPSHEAASKKIKEVSDDPSENLAARLGLPFAGYDEAEPDEILAAMANLPSSTVQAIKKYEAGRDEPDERIVHYSIGFAQSPTDRQEGRMGSDLDEDRDEDKAVAALTTREVPEEGVVQIGDGITGTGDPQIPHGSQKEDSDGGKPAARRRRRSAPKQAPKSESGSNE